MNKSENVYYNKEQEDSVEAELNLCTDNWQDCDDGYGGVFVACQNCFISHSLQLTESPCELVACQIQLTNQLPLIVCSIYHPPSSNESYLSGAGVVIGTLFSTG